MRRHSPFEFIHAFMTRTGRIDEQRLAKLYPELFAQFERAGVLKGEPASQAPSGRAE